MNKQLTIATITGLAIIMAFVINLGFAQNQAEAQTTQFPSREKVISVTGIATSSVEPDLLVITFGMENQKITAKEALAANSESMTAVVEAVKSLGISEDEISTSRISIYPVYDSIINPMTERRSQELVGYRVTNTIIIETPQLGKAADIIDNAVSSGANRVDNVSFTLSPEKQLSVKDDLIGQAILNAKTKAENALLPLNHKIVGVKAVSLSESGMPSPIPVFSAGFMAEDASMKVSTPVFSSDQDITTTANVVFLIGGN